ncbi:hypothetical protein [Kocuria sp. HSID16901]|uniref:hypothetical protein n=1 Tax=Kocuria sp. HSID16901 TaxID=2419505 RepID=UPI000660D0B0|nr:hypothetical protein [Kocuria sp. HSID16901]MCT1366979.1 hypothetical protein [Rothia sp. p3-SID1597]RUQ19864.1 hypothetical protein D8M21_10545 [Kocuria sp. HSID16901]
MEESTRRTDRPRTAPWARVSVPWETVESVGRGIPDNTRHALVKVADAAHRAGIPPRKLSLVAAGSGLLAALTLALSAWAGSDLARFWWSLLAVILLGLRLAGNVVLESLRTKVAGNRRIGDIPVNLIDAAADVLLLLAAGAATRQVWLTSDHLDTGLTLAWTAALLAVVAPYLTALGELGEIGTFLQGPMNSRRTMYVLIAAGILSWFEALGSARGYVFAVALVVIVAGWVTTIVLRLWFMGQELTIRRAEAAGRMTPAQDSQTDFSKAASREELATRRIDLVRPETPASNLRRPHSTRVEDPTNGPKPA